MPALTLFLTRLLPLLVTHAPSIISQVRGIFTAPEIGGDPDKFDEVLAANQKDIDRLAKPDSFRHKP
jgi:hypothetical protein